MSEKTLLTKKDVRKVWFNWLWFESFHAKYGKNAGSGFSSCFMDRKR